MTGRTVRALRWAGTVILIVLVLSVADVGEAVHRVARADLALVGLALGIAALDRLFMAVKWLPLLRVQLPAARASFAVKGYYVANLAGAVLPSTVGGDLLRAWIVGRPESRVHEVGVSILVERILGVVGSTILAIVAIGIGSRLQAGVSPVLYWVVAVLLVAVASLAAPFSADFRRLARFVLARWRGVGTESLNRVAVAYSSYRHHPGIVGWVGLLTLSEQLVPVVVFWILSYALGEGLAFSVMIVVVPLSVLAARLPISVAGLGVLEGALVLLLPIFGGSAEAAIAMAITYRLLVLVAKLPGAFYWSEVRRPGPAASPSTRDDAGGRPVTDTPP